jgi:hypothetical protein
MKICKYIRYLDIYTEDPVKSMETIVHSVRLQGSALVSYRLPSSTRLAGQPVLQDVIPIFIVGLSVYALFYFGASATLQRSGVFDTTNTSIDIISLKKPIPYRYQYLIDTLSDTLY